MGRNRAGGCGSVLLCPPLPCACLVPAHGCLPPSLCLSPVSISLCLSPSVSLRLFPSLPLSISVIEALQEALRGLVKETRACPW